MMFKECSSGIGSSNFGEMNGKRLTSAKGLRKNEFHGKYLRASRTVLSKVQHRIHFAISVPWPKLNTSASILKIQAFQHRLNTL